MAATIGNAIKALVEGGGLGVTASRDAADRLARPPYVTIQEGISVDADGRNDGGTGETVAELVQVNLWEEWRNPNDETSESPTLANALGALLHGALLDDAPMRVYGLTVRGRRRLLDEGSNRVQHAYTVEVRRTHS